MRTRTYNDLWFTADGDFILSSTGDLRATDDTSDRNQSAKQAVFHRIVCEANGWRRYPRMCGALEQFIGLTINPETLEGIENRIKYVLSHDNFFKPADVQVRCISLGWDAVAAVIFIKTIQQTPLITFSFDMTTGGITRTA